MNRDNTLPKTEEELRDWLLLAWDAGWRSRRSAIGLPGGSITLHRRERRAAFVASWDLPVLTEPSPTPLREAIQRMAEMADEDPDVL